MTSQAPKFVSMPAKDGTVRHPNALHVLLWNPGIPMHCIVFDGEKYWLFNACSPNGWAQRFEFKGGVDYLEILPSYSAFALNLPFKIRNLDPVREQYAFWYQYRDSLTAR